MMTRVGWLLSHRSIVFGVLIAPALLAVWISTAAAADESSGVRVEIVLDRNVVSQPVTGRLYLFLSQRGGVPMRGPDWFRPEPFFRLDVTDFKPGAARAIDDKAAGFPNAIGKISPGKYRAQAVFDHDFYEPKPSSGVGNIHSDVVELEIVDAASTVQPDNKEYRIRLTKLIEPTPFPDSEWVKEVVLKSELLERFHKREVVERAAVVLPTSYYDKPQERYPAIYIIPGFGGSHREGLQHAQSLAKSQDGETEFIRVYLSARCKWGHHVYADSTTNGPRGETLVREMIPHIDREYRTIAEPAARFVMGHSSGGWSSLWLQVSYPETFGGVWSSSPDPVDFRDFQQINLYADPPQNMYRDERGDRRPIARFGPAPALWFDSFTKMDDVIGRGGQLRSFEAVFSPLDESGLPKRLWNRQTGQIDPEVAKAWEKYDISLIVNRDWPRLAPLLAGKLHITMGTLDSFYLEGATRLLADRLKELGSDAQVTFIEGANHGSLLTRDYFARVRREMSGAYRKRHGQ